jgi:hypothetical protein
MPRATSTSVSYLSACYTTDTAQSTGAGAHDTAGRYAHTAAAVDVYAVTVDQDAKFGIVAGHAPAEVAGVARPNA